MLLLALLLAACGSTTTVTGSPGSVTPAASSPTATATSEPTVPLTTIRMLDQVNGWALTKSAILTTSDGGQTWRDVTPAGIQLNARSTGDFMDGNHAWVDTLQGSTVTVLRTSDGGANWRSATFPTQQLSLDRPHFITPQDGWMAAVTAQGMFHTDEEIYQTTNGGQNWTLVASTSEPASGLPAEGNKTGISSIKYDHRVSHSRYSGTV
jgi:photosystem II stability/assembly factor-like uncharacterized protein